LQPLRPILDAFEVRQPDCVVRFRHILWDDPFGPLRSGETDIQLLWLPVREPDLTVGPVLYTEPFVLALPATHPLTSRESVSLEDLAGQTVTTGARPAYWREAVVPAQTPGGQPIKTGPTVTQYQEMIPIIASGEAMSPVMAQTAHYFPHADIAYIPIHDAPLARWALIWRTAAETDLIRAFVKTAKDVGPGTQ
ncbi:LysR family substrate-binding domain-containing protein, partial [Nonomuraea sp. NPDC004297]